MSIALQVTFLMASALFEALTFVGVGAELACEWHLYRHAAPLVRSAAVGLCP